MKWQVRVTTFRRRYKVVENELRWRISVDGKVNECKSFIRLCLIGGHGPLSLFSYQFLFVFFFFFPPALRRTSVALFLSSLGFCYETISVFIFFSKLWATREYRSLLHTRSLISKRVTLFIHPSISPPSLSFFFLLYTHTHTHTKYSNSFIIRAILFINVQLLIYWIKNIFNF